MGPGSFAGLEGSNSIKSATQVTIPGLSADQVQRLLSLIHTPKAGYEQLPGKVSWMLNSGASCHMVGDTSEINDLEKISLAAVMLPNVAYTMSHE